MPRKRTTKPKSRRKSQNQHLDAYYLSARIIATLDVLVMALLFFPQVREIAQKPFIDIVAISLIPILLSISYLCSWKDLWWSGASALFILVVFLAFMTHQDVGETLPLIIILSLNLPTVLLIGGAALQHYFGKAK